MKPLFIFILLSAMSLRLSAQIFREETVDNTLVNKYGAEMQELRKKTGIKSIFGFSKSVTSRGGELNETTIIFYRDENGETQDKIVSARILSYKEVTKEDKIDTVVSVKEHTISDSLSFKASKVTKTKNAYIVVGNVQDNGIDIPIVLSTMKKETPATNIISGRFLQEGKTIFVSNLAVGCMFNAKYEDSAYLIKIFNKLNPPDYYGKQNDNCYSESFIVPSLWWDRNKNRYDRNTLIEELKKNFKN